MNELFLNIFLVTIILLGAGVFGLLAVFYREISSFRDSLIEFVTAPDADSPSPLAEFTEKLAHRIGHAAAIEAKTTLMGKASGEARLEQALTSDIAKDAMASKAPLVGALFDMFPSLGKRALKNPGVIDFVLSRLGEGVGSNPPRNNNNSSFREKLNKYGG